jgi:hypothetical protein
MFENTVVRGIFGPNWDDSITDSFIMNQTRNGENDMVINIVLCAFIQNFFGTKSCIFGWPEPKA